MIHFEVFGHGPRKLIGLHGWFGDQSSFRSLQLSLDPTQYQCVWLAHRGYGASKSVEGAYTMTEMADDALAVADQLGWESFATVGHSMGGKAAQLLAAQAGGRLTRLIAVSSAPAGPVPFDPQTRALFESATTEIASRRAVIDHSTGGRLSPVWVDNLAHVSAQRCDAHVQSAYLRSWADADFSSTVSACEVDTLVLAGAYDPVTTADACSAMFTGRFEKFRVESLDNSGHYPMDETPLALGAAVAAFLSPVLTETEQTFPEEN